MLKKLIEFIKEELKDGIDLGAQETFKEKPQTLASILPYRGFDEIHQLYNNAGSHGFVLETGPLCGATEETVRTLTSVFTDNMPKGCTVDVLSWASPKIGNLFTAYKESRQARGGIFSDLAKKRTDYLSNGAWQSLTDKLPLPVRNFRVVISAAMPGIANKKQLSDMVSLREGIAATLNSINMPSHVMQPAELISLIHELLQQKPGIDPVDYKWDKDRPLNLQMTSPEAQILPTKKGLTFINSGDLDGEIEARAFTVRELPQYWTQWQNIGLLGHAFSDHNRLDCPFITHFSFTTEDGAKQENRIKRKSVRAIHEADGESAKYQPSKIDEAKSLRYVSERINQGQKVVQGFYEVILFAPKAHIERREQTLRSIYTKEGWKLDRMSFVALPGLIAALPMAKAEGTYVKDLTQLGLTRTMITWTCSNLVPLQGEWRGNGSPLQLFLGRRGQVFFWDMFNVPEGNYNVSVKGRSGSGKSVLMQEMLCSLVGAGGSVRVLDDGYSFMNTCKLVDGQFVEFKPSSGIKLNPFSFIKSKGQNQDDRADILQFLVQIVAEMAAPNRQLSDEEMGLIEEAVSASWKVRESEATVTDVGHYLREHDWDVANRLGVSMTPYMEGGMHASFFDGPLNIDMNNPLIVFELNPLETKPELRKVIMKLLMFLVTQEMYHGDRSVRTSLIIDEAWASLTETKDAKFIGGVARRVRKYEGNLITGTQGINDYYDNAGALAAYQNSDWKITLGLTSDAIEQASREGRISKDPGYLSMLRSLRMQDRLFSEILIEHDAVGVAVGRLVLDPFSATLFSSKGAVFEAIQTLQKSGVPLDEAIERVKNQSSAELRVAS